MNGQRLIAKPTGMAATAAGGAVFKSIWRRADHGRDVPEPDDASRSWRAVLLAAVIKGAAFAVIRATVSRATARVGRKAQTTSPSEAASPPSSSSDQRP